ncbi:sensor histidine kinase, partial [Candidatus Saccharibacteria bacterium]|nr:sensor histidine kinase [Candidatus Saccharibacteria bacterium]
KRSPNKESVTQKDRESRAALVIRNFPWLLVLLLATLALQSAFEAIMQINDTKKVRALVARQKLLNEEKKSLVSLASHYLRTPVTLIASGVEMMSGESRAKTVLQNGVKKLQSTIESLIGKLESTEVNNTLVAPGEPARSRVSLWAPRVVWPLISSLVFIALINVVAIFWQEISSTALLIAAQVAILLVIGVLHLLAHNTFKRGSENYKYEKRLLTYQQQLDHLRNKFLREVNEELVPAVVSIDTHLVSGSSEKSAKYIKDGIAQLESTAQKFILISQLEEGAIIQSASDINLHEAAQSAKDGLNDDKRLVTIDVPHNATIRQPEFLMRTVLQSLLTNAAEHSKPDQAITVRARKHRKVTDISVTDKGEGISAEKLAKLFKPLSRAESSEDFSHEGIGLSLYIDQLIMHYLGGSLTLTSSPSKGTTAHVKVTNKSLT